MIQKGCTGFFTWVKSSSSSGFAFIMGSMKCSGFPGSSIGKESAYSVEDHLQCRRSRLDPWVRKIPREGNGNPLRYSCLWNFMNRGAWWATVHLFTRIGHDLATKPSPLLPWNVLKRKWDDDIEITLNHNPNPYFKFIRKFWKHLEPGWDCYQHFMDEQVGDLSHTTCLRSQKGQKWN